MTLADYITARLGEPFCYGRLDCVLFASEWIKAATGKDVLAGLPKWKTERGAKRVIRSVGGLESAIDARLKRIDPKTARDGDIAMHENIVFIFSGTHIVGPGMDGLQFIDRMKAQCAWSI